MKTSALAASYLRMANVRLRLLPVLEAEGEFAVVIRESQECVELALKSVLRYVGVDPPKWHDVGPVLLDNAALFPETVRGDLPEIAAMSKRLRKEREFSFYGDVDFIPTEEYTREDALEAISAAQKAVHLARTVIDTSAPEG